MKKVPILLIAVVLLGVTGSAEQPQWKAETTVDPLSGKSYIAFTLTGRFLTPPSRLSADASPSIKLRCDPTPHHKLSGKMLAGFIVVNTVLDLENGNHSTVQYRLDDGKLQTGSSLEFSYSTDYQAISFDDMFLNNMLWGHMITHKLGSNEQVHKVVVGVQEHLGGQIVMQFDMPAADQVSAACGAEYKK